MAGRPSNSKNEKTAIYALLDENGTVKYIGKTINPAARLSSHIWPNRKNSTPVANWSRSLRKRGGRPVMQILEWTDEWESRERDYISRYRLQGSRLLNISSGGTDMNHVTEASGRFPAYTWVMKFCARTKQHELAETIRNTWLALKRQSGAAALEGYDRHLRAVIHEVRPLAIL